MMTRAQKAENIKVLVDKFSKARAAFVVDYKGLNVEEITKLRKTLSPLDSEMKVVRNTLAKLALKENPDMDESFAEVFTGPNAVIFAYGEAPAPAKALDEFAKEVEELEIKSGAMDGQTLSKEKITYLAALPSKDELRAKLLGVFEAPSTKFVRTLNEVPSKFVRLLSAYKDSK